MQILIIGLVFYQATRGGQPFCLIYLVTAVLIPILLRQFTRDQWWLIPGGLVLERYRFWRRSSRLHRFHPETSILVIRHGRRDEHHILVSDGARTHRVTLLDRGLPILLAWLSTAPPPTDEQLLDYFAAGGEMPELSTRVPR